MHRNPVTEKTGTFMEGDMSTREIHLMLPVYRCLCPGPSNSGDFSGAFNVDRRGMFEGLLTLYFGLYRVTPVLHKKIINQFSLDVVTL